jgi:uncharacterized protein
MPNQTFRILSIDGGGLRGIIPVKILQKLEEITGKRIYEMFDLIAGTSTGGIISCAATVKGPDGKAKFTLQEIEQLFAEKANTIFPHASGFGRMWKETKNLLRPAYNPSGLQSVLETYFGEERLTDCLTNLFITSYDLTNNRGLFFKSRQAVTDANMDARLIDICRATSAAPTFFPAYEFTFIDTGAPTDNPKRICLDGGIFMNNPEIGAFVEVSKYSDKNPYNRPELEYDDICILSLGTGHFSSVITGSEGDHWGELQWAPNIADVMMQGVNQASTYQGDELTKDGHHLRVQVNIQDKKYDDMSDSSSDTRQYLLDAVNDQVFNNAGLMVKLQKFVVDADLKREKVTLSNINVIPV